MKNKQGELVLGLWGVIVVILVAVLAIGIVKGPSPVNGTVLFNNEKDLSDSQLVWKKKLSTDGIKRINLAVASSYLQVKSTQEKQIKVSYYAKNKDDEQGFKAFIDKDCIKIEEANKYFTLNWLNNKRKVIVEVPETLCMQYNLDLASGNMDIKDVKMCGLKAEGASGSLKVKPNSNQQLEKVDIQLLSGNVKFYGISKALNIDLTSGNVKYDGSYEEGQFDCKSGNIKVQTEKQPKAVKLQLISGDIKCGMPYPDDVSVTSQITSGSLKNIYTGEKLGQGTGKMGNGQTKFQADIMSGSVKIDKNIDLDLKDML